MCTVLACPYCNNLNIKPNGFDRHKAKRRFLCVCCRRSFQEKYDFVGSKPGIEHEIMILIDNGKTYHVISSTLGVSSKKIATAVRNFRNREISLLKVN